MRIVSLLPSATEIAYALGVGDQVVGVTHECDYTPQVRDTAVVTRSMLDHTQASSAEIDALVSSQRREQLSIYHLEADLLAEVQPDLILTQALCDVCAVSYTTVRQVVRDLGGTPRILSLEPSDLEGILETISTVGHATNRLAEATTLVAGLRERIKQIRQHAELAAYRPRVACLEWLDPPFSLGHWLPEMIELAGGEACLGQAG
jgi:iron complex transport system substrate-binding protein